MRTGRELVDQAREQIEEVTVDRVAALLASGRCPTLLDVREADEYEGGRIPGAIHVPRGLLELRIEEKARRDEPLIVYCAGGVRSALATRTLHEMGFRMAASLAGGFGRWQDGGHPVEKPRVLSPVQKERYRRHLILPEVGEEGQDRLLAARVLLLGAGGLGSPAALYLAAAGVGTLGIVDSDVVDLSNLQRQVLHTSDRIGQPKVESAERTIRALNPDVRVVPHRERLVAANVLELVRGYDVIVDGGDNFATRYLLNDASVLSGKPLVHGSIFRFEGQITTFVPGSGPCYRCLFPAAPPPELAPSCAEAGVLGVLPGVVGTLQANEVLKLILGKGEPLVGRLLLFDALGARFQTVKLPRDPSCAVCAPGREIRLVDGVPSCPA